jgi:hypothetical protein
MNKELSYSDLTKGGYQVSISHSRIRKYLPEDPRAPKNIAVKHKPAVSRRSYVSPPQRSINAQQLRLRPQPDFFVRLLGVTGKLPR